MVSDLFKAILLLLVLFCYYVVVVFCFLFFCCFICSLQPCDHLFGKGCTFGYFLVFLSLSNLLF